MEELRAFRQQAEIAKVRAEVRASLEDEADKRRVGGSAPGACLTPKTKRYVAAQSRVPDNSGEMTRLLTDGFETWEQVQDQLLGHPPATVKKLLWLLCPEDKDAIPRLKTEVVKKILAEFQKEA